MEERRARGGRLVAVPVPWMISPSVPELKVSVVENGDAIVEADVTAVRDGSSAEHAGVEITFRAGQWVRTYPASSDTETFPTGLFDSDVYQTPPGEEGFRSFRELWATTGCCPTPGFYEVLDSRWLVEMDAARFGCRHFVLEGHDMWLELLALDFAWRWSTRRAAAIELT